MRVLGFDVSSSCIGWGLIDINSKNELKLIDSGYYKPPKKGSLIERMVKTREEILKIINKTKPDNISIENIIQFMKGSSTAKTIIMLTTFNRMICLLAYDYLKKEPELFNVMTIRHGLKLSKDLPAKENMPDLVAHHLGIKYNYEYNKKGKKIVENYDRADGIAVCLYYSFLLSGKIVLKSKKTAKTTRKAKKK